MEEKRKFILIMLNGKNIEKGKIFFGKSPKSVAKKIAKDFDEDVTISIRETTPSSKKKEYGPYKIKTIRQKAGADTGQINQLATYFTNFAKNYITICYGNVIINQIGYYAFLKKYVKDPKDRLFIMVDPYIFLQVFLIYVDKFVSGNPSEGVGYFQNWLAGIFKNQMQITIQPQNVPFPLMAVSPPQYQFRVDTTGFTETVRTYGKIMNTIKGKTIFQQYPRKIDQNKIAKIITDFLGKRINFANQIIAKSLSILNCINNNTCPNSILQLDKHFATEWRALTSLPQSYEQQRLEIQSSQKNKYNNNVLIETKNTLYSKIIFALTYLFKNYTPISYGRINNENGKTNQIEFYSYIKTYYKGNPKDVITNPVVFTSSAILQVLHKNFTMEQGSQRTVLYGNCQIDTFKPYDNLLQTTFGITRKIDPRVQIFDIPIPDITLLPRGTPFVISTDQNGNETVKIAGLINRAKLKTIYNPIAEKISIENIIDSYINLCKDLNYQLKLLQTTANYIQNIFSQIHQQQQKRQQ